MNTEPDVASNSGAPADPYRCRTGPADPLSRRDVAWVLGLMFLAFLPRLFVAARLESVCDDGYFYLSVADAYGRGEFTSSLRYLNVNVYPVLLFGLSQLGLDPVTAGKTLGVAASCFVIPPLFGWLRRLLDRRVAIAACGVYAVHPEFIELAPEPIRDPFFWFATALALYWLWRAAAERSAWLFAVGGLTVAVAAHTRTEGWLLMIPSVAWPLILRRGTNDGILRTARGVATAAAMIPLFLVAFNVAALSGHDRWEWGKLEHLRLAYEWIAGPMLPASAPATVSQPAVSLPTTSTIAAAISSPSPPHPVTIGSPSADPDPSLADFGLAATALPPKKPRVHHESTATVYAGEHRVVTYLSSLAHTLDPVPLLAMLLGSIVWRRLLVRPEHLVLSAICAALAAALWVRLEALGEINGRYFLMCFFPASGAAGLGIVWTLEKLERSWAALPLRPRPVVAVVCFASLVGVVHVSEAIASAHPSRDAEANLGRALGQRLGKDRSVLVLPQTCRVGYFTGHRLPTVVLDDTPIESLSDRCAADVAILVREQTSCRRADELAANLSKDLAHRLAAFGWQPYDVSGLPGASEFLVLTRSCARPGSVASARDGDERR